MKCNHIQDLFSDYYDGDIQPGVKKEFETHLDSCERCRIEYDHFAAVVSVVQSIPPAVPSPGLFDRIEQEVRSIHSSKRVIKGVTFGLVSCAVAACLVVALYVMMSRDLTPTVPMAPIASNTQTELENEQPVMRLASPQEPASPVMVVWGTPDQAQQPEDKDREESVPEQPETPAPVPVWDGNVELALVITTRNDKADVASLNNKAVSFRKIIDENGGVQYQFNATGEPTEQVRHELEYLSDTITNLHSKVMRVHGTIAEISVEQPFYIIVGVPVDKLDIFINDLKDIGTHQKQIDPSKVLDSSASFDENNDQYVHVKIMLRK